MTPAVETIRLPSPVSGATMPPCRKEPASHSERTAVRLVISRPFTLSVVARTMPRIFTMAALPVVSPTALNAKQRLYCMGVRPK